MKQDPPVRPTQLSYPHHVQGLGAGKSASSTKGYHAFRAWSARAVLFGHRRLDIRGRQQLLSQASADLAGASAQMQETIGHTWSWVWCAYPNYTLNPQSNVANCFLQHSHD